MLLSLEILGFKSFPEATRIDLDTGITAIVGPNGSGKSNVTDAIRWGLSEQSARILRGQRMSDMIFSGTAQRRAMSYAEVILTFDNSKRVFDLDYDTVSISRRYHRSGESEYFINKTACRLKDINTLLVDTGIGLDGYSIVGQGKIDEILNERSDDRRLIFDEASGIVHYKARKAESERRLEAANQNLLRVDDILEELRRQAGPLKQQAADARRYSQLNDRYQKLDISLSWKQIKEFEQQADEAETNQSIAALELIDAEAALAAINKKNSKLDDEIAELEIRVDAERKAHNELSVKLADTTGTIALSREKKSSSEERIQQLEAEKLRLNEQISLLANTVIDRQERHRQLEKQCKSYESRLQEAKKALAAAESGLSISEKETDALRTSREELKDSLFQVNSDLQSAKAESSFLQDQLAVSSAELLGDQSDLNRAAFALEEVTVQLEKLRAELVLLEQAAAETKADRIAAEKQLEDIDQSIMQLKDTERHRAYEEDTLSRLEQNFEGYQKPVKDLMQAVSQQEDLKRGVVGPLGSLLSIPEDLALAVDVALGAMVHNIVCDTEETAKTLIEFLREGHLGRVTFLPQAALQVKKIDQRSLDALAAETGFVGLASDLIKIRPGLENVLDFALGRVLIADSLEDAIKIARKSGRKYRIVSRSGDIMYPGGSMSGGSLSKKQSGLAGRPARIRALQQERLNLAKKITSIETEYNAALDRLHLAAAREEDSLTKLSQQRSVVAENEFDYKSKDNHLTSLKNSVCKRQSAIEKTRGQIDRSLTVYQAAEQKSVSLREQITGLDEKIAQAETENRSASEQRELLRDDVTHLEISLHSLQEALQEVNSNLQRSDEEEEKHRQRIVEIDDSLESYRLRIKAEQENIITAHASLEVIGQELKKLEQSLQLSSQRQVSMQQEKRELYLNLQSKSEQLGLLRSSKAKQEAARERIAEQRDDLLNRIWETYNLTLHEIEGKTVEIDSLTQARRERNRIKNELEGMGAINHNALNDYEALSQRLASSEAQRKDIENARSELKEVISSLEHAMRERFQETFHRINQNFSQVFSDLFNGGIAQLSLSESEDILDANIEIRAQPPGKKLSRLSLLSGGERCLTAIALIFAILQLKPTPFVVFDEIESSLDDVNGQRFADYIKRYSDQMQFILVTHRKPTMEAADRLYGVTMQERGISRVLSMKLSNVDQE
ncbi:MAG: chromosome segregation protein SMC [Clostridiaceae bacterium]|nr:chromosome segregation protein SMC [Clostridiaceae bacterium]